MFWDIKSNRVQCSSDKPLTEMFMQSRVTLGKYFKQVFTKFRYARQNLGEFTCCSRPGPEANKTKGLYGLQTFPWASWESLYYSISLQPFRTSSPPNIIVQNNSCSAIFSLNATWIQYATLTLFLLGNYRTCFHCTLEELYFQSRL